MIQVTFLHYVSPEGAGAPPCSACAAALRHHSPKLQVSAELCGVSTKLLHDNLMLDKGVETFPFSETLIILDVKHFT